MKKILLALSVALLFQTTAFAADMSDWAVGEYETASSYGLLSYNVVKNKLTDKITREEFCELLMNVYRELMDEKIKTPEIFPFEDSDSIPVAQAYNLGIVSGKGDKTFKPYDGITREEMAKMLVNTLKASLIEVTILSTDAEEMMSGFSDSGEISDWAYAEMAVALKEKIISGVSENKLEPKSGASREQAIAITSRIFNKYAYNKAKHLVPKLFLDDDILPIGEKTEFNLSKVSGAKKYVVMIKDKDGERVLEASSGINRVILDTSNLDGDEIYSLTVGVQYESGIQSFALPFELGTSKKPIATPMPTPTPTEEEQDEENIKEPQKSENDDFSEDDELPILSEKEMRVFPDGRRYETEEEAEANMTEITIDVWSVRENGEKAASKKTLTVNKYLADDIIKIFEEIFNDPSQFPIKDIGCYSFRETAFGSVSEHSFGTCIDINANENYYCYRETKEAIVGSHWLPNEDIYSITPDGAVVKAFTKYDWGWGGSWTGSVNDYMHFTYLGK